MKTTIIKIASFLLILTACSKKNIEPQETVNNSSSAVKTTLNPNLVSTTLSINNNTTAPTSTITITLTCSTCTTAVTTPTIK